MKILKATTTTEYHWTVEEFEDSSKTSEEDLSLDKVIQIICGNEGLEIEVVKTWRGQTQITVSPTPEKDFPEWDSFKDLKVVDGEEASFVQVLVYELPDEAEIEFLTNVRVVSAPKSAQYSYGKLIGKEAIDQDDEAEVKNLGSIDSLRKRFQKLHKSV